MAEDWDIKPCSGVCSGCEREFADTEAFQARLMPGEEGYERADFCAECWQKAENSGNSGYSSWKGVYKAPAPKSPEALAKETAESLLRKLIEEKDRNRKSAIYVLAVMLERKKLFVERDTRSEDDGSRSIVYEHKETGEVFVIADPGLRLNQLSAVQEEVVTLLGGKPRQGVPAAPAEETQAEPAEDEADDGAQEDADEAEGSAEKGQDD